jgi:mxaC protein
MSIDVIHPWVLLLLPLATLPMLLLPSGATAYPWLRLVPNDTLSDIIGWFMRLCGVILIGGTVLGIAGAFRPQAPVDRLGRRAEIVVLLDRSGSMDQTFARAGPTYWFSNSGESKAKAARRLLAEFAAGRAHDLFGLVVFSAIPMPILPFTPRQDVIQAAIAATVIDRGLGETDIASGLLSAISYFDQRAHVGSRIVLLVSDGGAQLDMVTRDRLIFAMKRNQVALYWIYLRSPNSPGLIASENMDPANLEAVPEYFLHKFFGSIGIPYRAYEAEDTDALRQAVADIDRLADAPMHHMELAPPRDLASWCYGAALTAGMLLLFAKLVELRRWP